MEKHHLAYTFNLLREQEDFNFLNNYSVEEVSYFRRIVTDCVLATDLAKSMSWISNARLTMLEKGETAGIENEKQKLDSKIMRMQLAIKCADVSHPARLNSQHLEWSRRICEEFFNQGDKERSKNRKPSPLCDRNVPPLTYPQGQTGFINYVSKPLFNLLDGK